VELFHGLGPQPSVNQLVAWGWMEQEHPVDFLDAYHGCRPTAVGLKYLLYDERYHLVMIRKEHVEMVWAKIKDASQIALEQAMADHSFEISLARGRGWTPNAVEFDAAGLERAIERYERRGYITLERFQTTHKVEHNELILSGVLRYLEHRDPEKIASLDVGPKARHCLMYSTRWKTIFVKPGMSSELYRLIAVEVHYLG
jgi:hypothetical protein